MKSNRVTLIGYVGKDLSAAKLEDGSTRIDIRMATHYTSKSERGEKTRHTTWHNVVAWDATAEYAGRSFVKGSKIMVEGAIVYRNYIDSGGIRRTWTIIKAQSLANLDR